MENASANALEDESLTIELVCRLSLLLCEVESLNERLAGAERDRPHYAFVRSALGDMRWHVDVLISFLSGVPDGLSIQ